MRQELSNKIPTHKTIRSSRNKTHNTPSSAGLWACWPSNQFKTFWPTFFPIMDR